MLMALSDNDKPIIIPRKHNEIQTRLPLYTKTDSAPTHRKVFNHKHNLYNRKLV